MPIRTPFDSLIASGTETGDVLAEPLVHVPLAGEFPEETTRRVVTNQFRKARDLAGYGIPAYQDKFGDPQPVLDEQGAPLTGHSKRTSTAFDSLGVPRRLIQQPGGAPPVLGDAYEGAEIKTDKTGAQYKVKPGLPKWRVGTDETVVRRNELQAQDKELRATAAVLGRKLTLDEGAFTHATNEQKARKKELFGLLKEDFGSQGKLPEGTSWEDARKQVASLYDSQINSRAASATKWFSSDYTETAKANRDRLLARRAQALGAIDDMERRGSVLEKQAQIIAPSKEQKRAIEKERLGIMLQDMEVRGLDTSRIRQQIKQSEQLEAQQAAIQRQAVQPVPPPKIAPKGGGVVSDVAVSVASGINSVLKMAGDLYGLATGNMDNAVSRLGKGNIEFWEGKKSGSLQKMEKERRAAIDALPEDDQIGRAWEWVKATASNPRMVASMLGEQAPNLVAGGAAGLIVKKGAAKFLLKNAADDAAKALAVKKAGQVGVAGAVGTMAGMQGVDVGGGQYEELLVALNEMPPAQAAAIPEIADLLQRGSTLDDAKLAFALTQAQKTGALAAAVSIGSQMVPGGRILERAMVGVGGKLKGNIASRVAQGVLGGATQEMVEEGGGLAGKNVFARPVDPTRSLTKGMGETLAQAGTVGSIFSAVGGAASGKPPADGKKPASDTPPPAPDGTPAAPAPTEPVLDEEAIQTLRALGITEEQASQMTPEQLAEAVMLHPGPSAETDETAAPDLTELDDATLDEQLSTAEQAVAEAPQGSDDAEKYQGVLDTLRVEKARRTAAAPEEDAEGWVDVSGQIIQKGDEFQDVDGIWRPVQTSIGTVAAGKFRRKVAAETQGDAASVVAHADDNAGSTPAPATAPAAPVSEQPAPPISAEDLQSAIRGNTDAALTSQTQPNEKQTESVPKVSQTEAVRVPAAPKIESTSPELVTPAAVKPVNTEAVKSDALKQAGGDPVKAAKMLRDEADGDIKPALREKYLKAAEELESQPAAAPAASQPAPAPVAAPTQGRAEQIDRILKMAEQPMPKIVESTELLYDDGKWRSPVGGAPMGVSAVNPVQRRIAGYVIQNPDGTTGGVRLKTREEQEQRQRERIDRTSAEFRKDLEEMTPEQLASQEKYWTDEKAKQERLSAPLPSKKPVTEDSDAAKLRDLQKVRYKTAAQEKHIEILKARVAADPSKWSVGNGVSYKVNSGGVGTQTNRGFRIIKIDPKSKLAMLRSVADTGLTSSGGDADRIGDQWIHVAELKRDKKYDAPTPSSPAPVVQPLEQPPAPAPKATGASVPRIRPKPPVAAAPVSFTSSPAPAASQPAPAPVAAPTKEGQFVRLSDGTVAKVSRVHDNGTFDVFDGLQNRYNQDSAEPATQDDRHAWVRAKAKEMREKSAEIRKEAAEYNRKTDGRAVRNKGSNNSHENNPDYKGPRTFLAPALENSESAKHREMIAGADSLLKSAERLSAELPKQEKPVSEVKLRIQKVIQKRDEGPANTYTVTNIPKDVMDKLGWERVWFQPGQPQTIHVDLADGTTRQLFKGDVRDELIPKIRAELEAVKEPAKPAAPAPAPATAPAPVQSPSPSAIIPKETQARLAKMGIMVRETQDARGMSATIDGEAIVLLVDSAVMRSRLKGKDAVKFLETAREHEMRHLAWMEAIRRDWLKRGRKSPDGKAESLDDAFEREAGEVAAIMDAKTRKAVEDAYDSGPLTDVQAAAEFVRQLDEMASRGDITESMLDRLKAVIERIRAVLKDWLDKKAVWPKELKQAYESTERVMKELEAMGERMREAGAAEQPAPAEPQAKEPWQMTREDFDGHPLARAKYVEEMGKLDAKGVNPPPREFMLKAATTVTHKEAIQQALREGKPVPAEVLADYPDLAKQPPAPATPQSEGAILENQPSPDDTAREDRRLSELEDDAFGGKNYPIVEPGESKLARTELFSVPKKPRELGPLSNYRDALRRVIEKQEKALDAMLEKSGTWSDSMESGEKRLADLNARLAEVEATMLREYGKEPQYGRPHLPPPEPFTAADAAKVKKDAQEFQRSLDTHPDIVALEKKLSEAQDKFATARAKVEKITAKLNDEQIPFEQKVDLRKMLTSARAAETRASNAAHSIAGDIGVRKGQLAKAARRTASEAKPPSESPDPASLSASLSDAALAPAEPQAKESEVVEPSPAKVEAAEAQASMSAAAIAERATQEWGKYATEVVEPLKGEVRALESEWREMAYAAGRAKPDATGKRKASIKSVLKEYGVETKEEFNALANKKANDYEAAKDRLEKAQAKLTDLAKKKDDAGRAWSRTVTREKEKLSASTPSPNETEKVTQSPESTRPTQQEGAPPQGDPRLDEGRVRGRAGAEERLGAGEPDPSAPFYSALTRTVQNFPQETMTVQQAIAAIQKGAKKDEISMSGILTDPLSPLAGKQPGDKVTKAELLGWQLERQATAQDVVLGAPEDTIQKTGDTWRVVYPDGGFWGGFTTLESAQEAADFIGDGIGVAGTTHFSQYQLPGADEGSYREQFVTWPSMEETRPTIPDVTMKDVEAKDPALARDLDEVIYAYASRNLTDREMSNELQNVIYGRSDTHTTELRDRLRSAFPEITSAVEAVKRWKPKNWRDGHSQYSGIANPIGRIRRNIRTVPLESIRESMPELYEKLKAEGRPTVRIYFIEEAQLPSATEQAKAPPELFKGGRGYTIIFKRALRDAVDEGADAIAWTTGEQQAERYDLSKQLSRVVWNQEKQRLAAYDKSDVKVISETGVTPEKLEEYVGKDAAKRLVEMPAAEDGEFWTDDEKWGDTGKHGYSDTISGAREAAENNFGLSPDEAAEFVRATNKAGDSPNVGDRELAGVDLKVGGEGLKRVYDQMLPAIANDLAKKFGVKVGTAEIGTATKSTFEVLDADGTSIAGPFITRAEAERELGKYGGVKVQQIGGTATVHSLPIPDALRAQQRGGNPIFAQKPAAVTASTGPHTAESVAAEPNPDIAHLEAAGLTVQEGEDGPAGTEFDPANATIIHESPKIAGWMNRIAAAGGDAVAWLRGIRHEEAHHAANVILSGSDFTAINAALFKSLPKESQRAMRDAYPNATSDAALGAEYLARLSMRRNGVTLPERASKTRIEAVARLEAVLDGTQPDAVERHYENVETVTAENTASYRGEHSSPGSDSAPAYDLTGNEVYPKDVYQRPDWYESEAGLAEMYKIQRLKGNPDAPVWIYRAVPKSEAGPMEGRSARLIQPGDWVTTSKQYAKEHGESALRGEYVIASKRVAAKDIHTNGDSIFEWGYNPEPSKPLSASTPSRITPEQDRAYMAAVEAGDMETAQRMVDSVAGPRANMEEVSASEFSDRDAKDGFLYHVTTKDRVDSIVYEGDGLLAGRGGQFHGAAAQNNSKGKIFLTERNGVAKWLHEIEQQLTHSREYEEGQEPSDDLTVIRIPRHLAPELHDDFAEKPAEKGVDYFTTKSIPASPQAITRDAFPGTESSGAKFSNLLGRGETSAVESSVVASIKNSKVLDPIIESIPVDVVNVFGSKERATDMLLHDPAGFQNALSVNADPSVGLFEWMRFRDNAMGVVAGARTELGRASSSQPASLNGKMFAAVDALQNNLISILRNLASKRLGRMSDVPALALSKDAISLGGEPAIARAKSPPSAKDNASTFEKLDTADFAHAFDFHKKHAHTETGTMQVSRIIPLSERFNPESSDIRYAAHANQSRTIADATAALTAALGQPALPPSVRVVFEPAAPYGGYYRDGQIVVNAARTSDPVNIMLEEGLHGIIEGIRTGAIQDNGLRAALDKFAGLVTEMDVAREKAARAGLDTRAEVLAEEAAIQKILKANEGFITKLTNMIRVALKRLFNISLKPADARTLLIEAAKGFVRSGGNTAKAGESRYAAPDEARQPGVYGIKNAETEADRILFDLWERGGGGVGPDSAVVEQSRQKVENDPEGAEAIFDGMENGSLPTTAFNQMVVLHLYARAKAGLNRLNDAINETKGEASSELMAQRTVATEKFQRLIDVAAAAGSEASQALRIRRSLLAEDYSYAGILKSMQADNRGKPLTQPQKDLAAEMATKIKEAAEKKDAAEKDVDIAAIYDEVLADIQAQIKAAAEFEGTKAEMGRRELAEVDAELVGFDIFADTSIGLPMEAGQANAPKPMSKKAHELVLKAGRAFVRLGNTTQKAFDEKMVEKFGPKIEPYLSRLFEQAKALDSIAPVKTKTGKIVRKPKKQKSNAALIEDAKDEDGGEVEITKGLVRELVANEVMAGAGGGVTGKGSEVMPAAIRNVTAQLQELQPGITEDEVRDIFTDYGKPQTKLSKEPLAVKMREIRRLGQLASAARDAMTGVRQAEAALAAANKDVELTEPKLTGRERDKATQDVRDAEKLRIAAIKTLVEAAEAAGIPLSHGERTMKSSLDAAKTRMRNAIADVKREMETLARTPTYKRGINYDAEATALRDELAVLRKERDAIFGPQPKKPISDEQRLAMAIAAAKRAEADWNKRLADARLGLFRPRAQPLRRITSAELEQVKARSKEAREAHNELKAADALQQEAAKEKALLKSIEELEAKIASGDIGQAAKPQTAATQRVAELTEQRDALRARIASIKKAGSPVPDLEAKKLAALEAEFARVAEGKAPTPKAATADTEAVAFARQQLEALRAKRDEDRRNLPFNEAEWLEKAEAAVARRTKKLQEKLDSGDIMPAVKPERPTSPELDKARFKYDELVTELHRRRFEIERAGWSNPKKAARLIFDLLTTSRAVITSADLSAVLRQGGFIGMAHPKLSLKNAGKMLQSLVSKEAAHRFGEEIKANPLYRKAVAAKLSFTDSDAISMQKHEEAHMSRWINENIPAWLRKIPVLGSTLEYARRATAASARAYSTFLNLLRMDSFELMVNTLSATPGNPTKKELDAVANYINVATGRGKLPERWKTGATVMNTVFFAPLNAISRFQLVLGQPLYGGTKRTRKLIAKEYARYLTGVSVVLMLAQLGQDDDDPPIETDPRSSDFGKVRFGNTRLDVMSGLLQPSVFLARTVLGETKTISGKVRSIRGADIPYGGDNWFEVAARFGRTKLAPAIGGAADLLSGTNVVGQPVTGSSVAQQMTVPMSVRDITEAMEENGAPKGVILSALALLGMGMNTFDPAKPKPHTAIFSDSPSLPIKVPVPQLDKKPARPQFQGF